MTNWWQPEVPFAGSEWVQDNQPCVPPSTFRDLMYAFPKPRLSGRVLKPRSAGNSPSSAGRRRTTTMPHGPFVYRQPPSQDYQAPLNAALLASAIQRERPSRPISWHCASMQPEYPTLSPYYPSGSAMTPHNFPAIQACPQPLQTMTSTWGDGNLLQSFTASGLPVSEQTFALSTAQTQLPIQDSSFLQVNNLPVDAVSWDGSTPGFPTSVEPVSNDWPFDLVSMNQSIPSVGVPGSTHGSVSSPGRLTEPPTPDFLPIQQFGDNTDSQSAPTLEKPKPEGELVGMGLYNSPDVFSEGLLYGLNGKGLKLEETFTPSPDNEADDNDAEDDDQQESNEAQAPKQSGSHHEENKQFNQPVESVMQRSFFFEEDDDPQQRVVAQSRPSFNLGAISCMNYGYGWI